METPRRPSTLQATLNTPPTSPDLIYNVDIKTPSAQQLYSRSSVLTPPTSPRLVRSPDNRSQQASTPGDTPQTSDLKHRGSALEPIQTDMTIKHQPLPTDHVTECPFDIEILKDARGRDAYFGTGAWSIVFKATTHSKSSVNPRFTPPSSPVLARPELVAVKKPARGDSQEILQSEAKTLDYLQRIPHTSEFVVPFYGVIDKSTIVLAAIPYTLEAHIRKCTQLANQAKSTSALSASPVIGTTSTWLVLAYKLVTALAWLHTHAGVVHGDLKPGNILLSPIPSASEAPPESSFGYTPLLTDFSSSQLLASEVPTPNTLSAVTREYTAPELLSSAVLRDPESTATPDSDVFSLAVTLLVAATGQLLVYPGSMFQRQVMATQGWMVLEHVRNGPGGERVPRKGIVERSLQGAVRKVDKTRINAAEWLGIVDEIARQVVGDL